MHNWCIFTHLPSQLHDPQYSRFNRDPEWAKAEAREPQNSWGWPGPPEVTWAKPLLKQGYLSWLPMTMSQGWWTSPRGDIQRFQLVLDFFVISSDFLVLFFFFSPLINQSMGLTLCHGKNYSNEAINVKLLTS